MASKDVDEALTLHDQELLNALVALPEDQWFERKSGRIEAKDLAVALVAMANADGGTIVVGIHDGRVDPPSTKRANDLRQAAMDHTVPPVRVRCKHRSVGDDADVLVLQVEPGEQAHTLVNGTAYLRVGDESRKLSLPQFQELAYDRGNSQFEASPVPLAVSDLSPEQMATYTAAIGAAETTSMLRARDLLTRKGAVTVAACLLFADRPQLEFPSAHVRVLRFGADERGTGGSMTLEEAADIRVDGSLPVQIAEAAAHIERLLPKWRQLGPEGLFAPRSRIPRDAWLEGLVNAVVHRSYSMAGDHIRVEIFPNRIEITSPGRFPGIVDPTRPLEITRYARNPRIARVCADLGITRELGEGIQRIFAEMRRAGLTDPVYTQLSGAVRLTLMAADALPDEVLARLTPSARSILNAMRLAAEPCGTGALAAAAGVTRMTATRALGQLAGEGLVRREGQSPRDPRATWHLL
ncbi:ATP-binding protein [Luteococcus sp. Sow4_B9]|uniref:ATP-binding protein n=1 Tax=Luteococcus sp. Sow4_B9 TaxID=3438792 RepID=UPI003F95CCEB